MTPRSVYGKAMLGLPVNENVSGLEDWIGKEAQLQPGANGPFI